MRQHVERLIRNLTGLFVARLEPTAEYTQLERHSAARTHAREPAWQVLDNLKLLLSVPLNTGHTAPSDVRATAAGDLLDEAHHADPERRIGLVFDPISHLQRSHPMPPRASRR